MCRSILIQSALSILLMLILILDSFRSRASWLPNGTCQVTGSAANSRASDAQELGWWNGRHVRLRGVCRKACGFKSRPEHHYFIRLESWQVSSVKRFGKGRISPNQREESRFTKG